MQTKEMEYLKSFKDVCKKINSSLDYGEVLDVIAENTVRLLGVKACSIYLLDQDRKQWRVSASHGLSDAYIRKGPISLEKSISECLTGTWVWIPDATSDPRIQYPEKAKREGIASILSVPIYVRENIIGVLRIYCSEPREFSDLDNEFISGLTDLGGIGIENARMYDHLKLDHEKLIRDVHQWFEFGQAH
ncbi:MAG: GAF domain-containing protein [Ignavibacteria bacterium]|nr:GAF domain-containing protein [Ignavibacteria bacterium]